MNSSEHETEFCSYQIDSEEIRDTSSWNETNITKEKRKDTKEKTVTRRKTRFGSDTPHGPTPH